MDCRRSWAVDDDRSRRIKLAIDDDRSQRRRNVDDDRSSIAFYQAQVKASLDRIDKNLRSIRRMRMSSATIPEHSSSSFLSSASRKCHQSRIKPIVSDDYPPLDLPLTWRDPPSEYPLLELPLKWRNPLPDLELKRDYLPSKIPDSIPPPTHTKSDHSFRPHEMNDDPDQTCYSNSSSSSRNHRHLPLFGKFSMRQLSLEIRANVTKEITIEKGIKVKLAQPTTETVEANPNPKLQRTNQGKTKVEPPSTPCDLHELLGGEKPIIMAQEKYKDDGIQSLDKSPKGILEKATIDDVKNGISLPVSVSKLRIHGTMQLAVMSNAYAAELPNYIPIKEAAFLLEVCNGLHALSIAEIYTNDREVFGKASSSGCGNIVTAGVEILGLNFTCKVEPNQCTQDARRNAADDFDLDFKNDFEPNLKRLVEVMQKLKVSGTLPKINLKGWGMDKEFVKHGMRKPSTELHETDMYRIISLLSIVCHSGMGKTTLLQQIYEDEMAKEFDLKIGSVAFYKTSETESFPKNDFMGWGKFKEFIVHWLRNPSNELHETDLYRHISLQSIVGHNGMENTTLCKDEEIEKFDLKTWVCVSSNFDVEKVIAQLLESLKINRPPLGYTPCTSK